MENVDGVDLYWVKIRYFDAKGTLRARDSMEELLKATDELIFAKTGKHLDNLQQIILEGTLQGKKYSQIAAENNRTSNHIREVASELWQQLSEILGEKIKKNNYRVTLERVKLSKISKYVQIGNFKICSNEPPHPQSSIEEKSTIDFNVADDRYENKSQVARFPAKVATIIDDYHVAINRGSLHGIRQGQRVLIYSNSTEEILDPDTGESLGTLEIVKGTGKIVNIQENISTVESDRFRIERKRIDRPYIPISLSGGNIIEELPIPEPFDNPEIGDEVKPI